MKIEKAAAVVVAGILIPDAALHLFWAASGSSWPASTTSALSRGLLNADVSFRPANLVIIASLPMTAGVLVLARANLLGRFGRRLPTWLPRLGTVALTAGVSLRFLAGIVWAAGIGADSGSAFYRLNIGVYTPLCAVLAAAAIIVLLRKAPALSTTS